MRKNNGIRATRSTYKLFIREESLGIGVVLVLILVFGLAERLLELSVVLRLLVGSHLGFEGGKLSLSFLLDTVCQGEVADSVLDDCAVLLESSVSEGHQILECLEGELAQRVLVVVVVVLHHVLSVKLDVLVILEGPHVVFLLIIGASTHLLEPHGLVVVDADVVAAILDEDIHDLVATLNIADLESVHCANRIDSTICLVHVTGFLVQLSGLLSVATLLVYLTLQGVELEHSRSMFNALVAEVHGLSEIVLEEIVLTHEVVEPEHHSWVLFLFITSLEGAFALHRGDCGGQEAFDLSDLFGDVIELTQVEH